MPGLYREWVYLFKNSFSRLAICPMFIIIDYSMSLILYLFAFDYTKITGVFLRAVEQAMPISVRLEGKTVFLNFSRETVMDVQVEKEEKDGVSIYYLLLESIVNSICFEHRDVDRVKFSFGGKEYRYVGNFGPIDKGLKPDWRILMR